MLSSRSRLTTGVSTFRKKAAVIRLIIKVAEGEYHFEVVSVIEDMKDSSGVPRLEPLFFIRHKYNS